MNMNGKLQCEFLEECPLFIRFHSQDSVNLWITMYCKGLRCNECARKILKKNNQNVPITLLPNGKELITLKNLPKINLVS